ncbi:Gag polyprotein [Folsomia candida]|uniref:Gag polyprotein n=1 Tax=Folsomia candida TaxID=158441 RepID=A0A226F1T3_FOLCA|nr:Gag polyprotein [Folsomia candida]
MTSKIRSAWRTKATTYCRQATEEFKKLAPNKKWLKILKLKLEEVRIKLQAIEETSMNETTTSGDGEDEKYEEYDEKILCCIADIEEECQPDPQQAQQQQMGGAGGSGAAMGGAGATSSSSYYFPRMKLREFSGELTEWLGFWDSFKIVHDDKGLDDVRKFQFLLGCMAVEALRSNFGKEKLLQLVYVRELVSMSNGRNGHESLSSLFNKLKSRYEALQTLGVTTQQASIFLYAIVESCLSEDVLTAWQRSSDFGRDGSKERPPKTDMDYLMDFLQREVENEVQRNMARSGYGETSATPKSSSGKGHHRERRDSPSTAANLFGGAVHDGKQQCLFCKKGHPSSKCWKAQRMSLEERQHLVRNCGVCFCCLQGGHLAKSCKAGVQCSLCTKRGHLALMCRLGSDKKTDEGPDANVAAHMVSQSVTKDVQLYTLNVKLRGKRGNVNARLLFDSGCQRSYIKKSTVAKLGISAVGREEFRKALFGGQVTEVKSHNRYKLELLNVDGQRPMSLELLEEDTICAKIGRVPPGPWIAELAKKKVTVGDVGHGSAEINLLIGGDQFGQLLTNKVIQLECGLTAIETSLGWTVGGRVPVVSESSAMVVTCLSVNELQVSQLWDLDAIWIRDDPCRKTKAECEEVAKQHFQENVTKDDDGRYCVALPWKNGEQKMSSNRVVAEKRLESALNYPLPS